MAIFFLVIWNQAGTGTPERTTRFTRAPEMPADKLAPTDAARQRPPGVTAVPTAGEEAFGEDAKPAQLPTNTNAYRVMPAVGVERAPAPASMCRRSRRTASDVSTRGA